MQERIGIAGSGAIACGLAVTAARNGDVLLWARSHASAERARATVSKTCSKLAEEGIDPDRVQVVDGLDALADATFLVEAVVEHHGSKASVLTELAGHAGPDAVFATTTSSLSVSELARVTGHPDRFVGLHVFNPVTRMKLIELAFPQEASSATRERTHALCDALGKTGVAAGSDAVWRSEGFRAGARGSALGDSGDDGAADAGDDGDVRGPVCSERVGSRPHAVVAFRRMHSCLPSGPRS